jgi:hypothetical protein
VDYFFMEEFESTFDEGIKLAEVFNHAAIGIARVGIEGDWLSVN